MVKLGELLRRSLNAVYLGMMKELHLKTLLKRRNKEKKKRMLTLEKMMKWPTSLWMKKKLMRMELL